MSEIKLLPCPFCGGEVKMYSTKIDAIQECHDFHCDSCNMTISYDYTNKQEAIEAWNTRKPMERIVERLEEELKLADEIKEKCARENQLMFDNAKGYATGISNAIYILKAGGKNE